MISPDDLTGVDEKIARRVLSVARSIVPCLDSLEGEPKLNAVAILLGVVEELPAAGAARTKSLSRNGTSITFDNISSAFTSDHRDALRALCGAGVAGAGAPVGSFPEGGIVQMVWPEGR